MALTFFAGLAPRAVFTLQAGSPLILTVSKTLVGISGPIEGSKPESAASARTSAASKEVLAVDHSPASSTSRGARRASVPPDTASSCGRLTAFTGLAVWLWGR
jgi:hypothetical protein